MSSTSNTSVARAVFLVKNGDVGGAFQMREIPIPRPGKGEILIENEGFGLNFADVMSRLGLYREAPPLPFVPGYDCVGRVMQIGEGVDANWLGKRVVALTRFGSYASHCLTKVSGLALIPETMDPAAASALGVQYTTAYYAAMHAQRLLPGERVLIHAGAGGVGSALIQLCKLMGCEVFATAGSAEKLELMRHNGADHVINYRTEDYESTCRQLLGNLKMDVSFNAVGGTTFKKDLRLLGAGGRMVLYGAADRADSKAGFWPTLRLLWRMGLILPIMLMAKSRSIIGVNVLKLADYRPDIVSHCMSSCVCLFEEGKIAPISPATYPITELETAHKALENRLTSGKVYVSW